MFQGVIERRRSMTAGSSRAPGGASRDDGPAEGGPVPDIGAWTTSFLPKKGVVEGGGWTAWDKVEKLASGIRRSEAGRRQLFA